MRCIHESNHLTHTSSVEIFDFWPSRLDRDEPPDRCAAPLQGWWKHELNRYCAVTDALTCGKDAHRIGGEEKTSDSDGPGDQARYHDCRARVSTGLYQGPTDSLNTQSGRYSARLPSF